MSKINDLSQRLEIEKLNIQNSEEKKNFFVRNIIETIKPTNLSGAIYYKNEKDRWEIDSNNSLKYLITKIIPSESVNTIYQVYTKVVGLAEVVYLKYESLPTLYIDGQKLIFRGSEKSDIEYEQLSNDIFNFFDIQTTKNEIDLPEAKRVLEKLLSAIFPDQAMRQWALANYLTVFMPWTPETAIINIGEGEDGKTTIKNFIQTILPDHLQGNFNLDDDSQFSMSNFENRTALFEADYTPKKKLNVPIFKKKTTRGKMVIEQKGKDQKQIYNISTLYVDTNEDLRYGDASNATERRLNYVLFENTRKGATNFDIWLNNRELNFFEKNKTIRYLFLEECIAAFLKSFDFVNNKFFPAPNKSLTRKDNISQENNFYYGWLVENPTIVEKLRNNEDVEITRLKTRFETYLENASPKTGKLEYRMFYKNLMRTLKNQFKIDTIKVIKRGAFHQDHWLINKTANRDFLEDDISNTASDTTE